MAGVHHADGARVEGREGLGFRESPIAPRQRCAGCMLCMLFLFSLGCYDSGGKAGMHDEHGVQRHRGEGGVGVRRWLCGA